MVDRCVCSNVMFIDIKKVIDMKGITSIENLRKNIRFGKNCELCLPYVKLIFKTGKTEFEPVSLPENINE